MPHTYSGIAVSLLFLARLAYRFIQAYMAAHTSPGASVPDPSSGFQPASMVQRPLTMGIFFVLAGYYVCYYSRVLWKSKHMKPEDLEIASAAAPK